MGRLRIYLGCAEEIFARFARKKKSYRRGTQETCAGPCVGHGTCAACTCIAGESAHLSGSYIGHNPPVAGHQKTLDACRIILLYPVRPLTYVKKFLP